ncbi:MAG: hypothetical protein Q9159_004612 [Coniocarpon cinnabarinum]
MATMSASVRVADKGRHEPGPLSSQRQHLESRRGLHNTLCISQRHPHHTHPPLEQARPLSPAGHDDDDDLFDQFIDSDPVDVSNTSSSEHTGEQGEWSLFCDEDYDRMGKSDHVFPPADLRRFRVGAFGPQRAAPMRSSQLQTYARASVRAAGGCVACSRRPPKSVAMGGGRPLALSSWSSGPLALCPLHTHALALGRTQQQAHTLLRARGRRALGVLAPLAIRDPPPTASHASHTPPSSPFPLAHPRAETTPISMVMPR